MIKQHIIQLIKNKLLVSIKGNFYCVNNSSSLGIMNMIIIKNYFSRTKIIDHKILFESDFLIYSSNILRDFFEYKVSIEVQIALSCFPEISSTTSSFYLDFFIFSAL